MAKKEQQMSIIVKFGRIAWIERFNFARETETGGVDYGDTKRLKELMIKDCWRKTADGTIEVERFDETKIKDPTTGTIADVDALLKEVMAKREVEWKTFRDAAAVDSSKSGDLLTFEDLFVEKEKLIVPDFLGTSGNRRSSVFFPAMLERRRNNMPIDDTVPVIVKMFESDTERLEAQVSENEDKADGFMPMTDISRLRVGKMLFELGRTQKQIRDRFPSHGQKIWWFFEFNRRFPALRLYQRALSKPDSPDHIRFSALKHGELPNWGIRTDAEELKKENQKLKDKGKAPLEPANEADFGDYINRQKVSTSNKPKIMERDNIEGLMKGFPVGTAAVMAEAIITNNTEKLEKIRHEANGRNAFDSLCEQGEYPELEEINIGLLRIPKGPARNAVLKAIRNMLPAPVPTAPPAPPAPPAPEAAPPAPEAAPPAPEAAPPTE